MFIANDLYSVIDNDGFIVAILPSRNQVTSFLAGLVNAGLSVQAYTVQLHGTDKNVRPAEDFVQKS